MDRTGRLPLVEPCRCHGARVEERRLLGLQQGDHHVARGRRSHHSPGRLQRDRDRGRVVVGTGPVAHRVVVRGDQDRRLVAFSARRDRDQIDEREPVRLVPERQLARVRLEAEVGQPRWSGASRPRHGPACQRVRQRAGRGPRPRYASVLGSSRDRALVGPPFNLASSPVRPRFVPGASRPAYGRRLRIGVPAPSPRHDGSMRIESAVLDATPGAFTRASTFIPLSESTC